MIPEALLRMVSLVELPRWIPEVSMRASAMLRVVFSRVGRERPPTKHLASIFKF